MDQNSRRDNFAKAKIEEPNQNLRLPKNLFVKADDGDPLHDLHYLKIFGFLENFVQFSQDFCCDNTRKGQQEAENVTSGPTLDRKVYRIRNKELVAVFGDEFEGMNEIQRVSKATIGILVNTESNLLKHSFLDFVGSAQEVKTAEELVLDKVLKTYSSLSFPVILMPPIIFGNHIDIPLHKVNHVIGNYSTNLLKMEMESGAWIKIEPGASSHGSEWSVVNVYGPQENINKAKLLIQSVISSSEHEESSSAVGGASSEPVHQQDLVKAEDGDVGPTSAALASGCYGSGLQCGSHA